MEAYSRITWLTPETKLGSYYIYPTHKGYGYRRYTNTLTRISDSFCGEMQSRRVAAPLIGSLVILVVLHSLTLSREYQQGWGSLRETRERNCDYLPYLSLSPEQRHSLLYRQPRHSNGSGFRLPNDRRAFWNTWNNFILLFLLIETQDKISSILKIPPTGASQMA